MDLETQELRIARIEDIDFESDTSTVSDDDWAEADANDCKPESADLYDMEDVQESSDSDLPPSPILPSDMIDPSQYRQIGFVVRSDLSKKIQSFAELITASQALRKAWKRFMLPTSQQCMKYRSTDHADIRIFRHNRTSLLRAGDDHGFRQLQKLFSLQDSALVISGSDGLTRDRDELCRFLASFENDTMMYFFDGDNFRRRFKSRDLASRLNPLTSQRQQSTDIQSFAKYLDVLKRIEKVAEMNRALTRLCDETDHRPITRRMVKILGTVTERSLNRGPDGFADFRAAFDRALRRVEQADDEEGGLSDEHWALLVERAASWRGL